MYCIKCGVELAESEKTCPLCNTLVFHPDFPLPNGEKPYPEGQRPAQQVTPFATKFILTMLFVGGALIPTICDLQINYGITWSGYIIGALLMSYVWLVLPLWFRQSHPLVFLPCDFGAVALFLLYIDLATKGSWFLPFGLPVVGFFGAVTTAVVALVRHLKKGRMYVFGGAAISIGIFMPIMELLLTKAFPAIPFYGWSVYPLSVLTLLGISLIVIAVSKPLQETLERKFFL